MLKIRGAFLGAKSPKQVSEKFKVQEFYLDCSRYSDFTGEKYENYVCLQIVNDKLDLSAVKRGQLIEVEFFINGRLFSKKDGTRGQMQNLNAQKFENVLNTSGDLIFISEDQIGNVQIPE